MRQEHLAGTEQIADDVHAIHQRSFDDIERAIRGKSCFLGVVDHEFIDAIDERVLQALADRQFAPAQILRIGFRPRFLPLVVLCDVEQPLGGIVSAIENDILNRIP